MKRMGSIVEVKPECVEEYKRLHVAVWPEVLATRARANIRNYTIYLRKLNNAGYFLFSYFEYTGDDYNADMAIIAACPKTQEFWKVCKPCLIPLDEISMEQCWAPMEEVFHFL